VLNSSLEIPTWATGLVLTVIVALVVLGGVKRIASVNEKIVPSMAIFFMLLCLVALGLNIVNVPNAFKLIFTEAFNFKSAVGGIAGYGIFSAMRYGVGRGVFTNEAGLGSAPIAHAASSTKDPVKQGLWGTFEVFVTTIIICTMTALVVLTSDAYSAIFAVADKNPELNGASLSSTAFNEAIPYVGKYGVALATIFFSLSTILGWAYYGEVCAGYLFKKHSKIAVIVYKVVYVVFVFIGAVASIDVVWTVADCFNALMALPNLIALVVLSKVVIVLTKEHFNKKNGLLEPSKDLGKE
jgi:AGCS family alanine or glycine:cation symporter